MMKKIQLITLFLFLGTANLLAQKDASVEESIYGVQLRLLGLSGHNERRLSDQFALRTEVGFSGGIGQGFYERDVFFILIPEISVAGRWYYNLQKRLDKGRNISKNSGNFIALKLGYQPDWFKISSEDNIDLKNSVYSSLKWGIKRTILKHLTYEAGIGLGVGAYFDHYQGENFTTTYGFLDLHLRIGYTF